MFLVKFLCLVAVSAAIGSCSCAGKPDIAAADSLAAAGQYREAVDLLKKGQFAGGMTSIEKKRIKTRIDRWERVLFFLPLREAITAGDWKMAGMRADSLNNKLKRQAGTELEAYQFDFLFYSSVLDSLNSGTVVWKQDLEKALTFYTPDHDKEQRIYEKLAFYYAGIGEYKKGREHLDKAMRKMRLTQMDSSFKAVYHSYMEGHFKQAGLQLSAIADSLKDPGWLAVQRFISRFGDKLTMEDRFKLW